YPLLRAAIEENVGPEVCLIDAAAETARCLRAMLQEQQLLSETGGEHRFFVSDAPENFAETARIFLGHDIERR
ncbi:MAG: glutamate racemase, partial [Clostridia bacterium]|nr:glutamate racemase [Clostridia bacterium]